MSDRKLATIRRISKIEPIPGADKIVKATVDGWQLVTAIANGFKEGDLVVYCEIDSWLPTEVASFLTKEGKEPNEYNGVKGERLRTIRLRGQLSQGLLLPIKSDATGWFIDSAADHVYHLNEIEEGRDLTDLLGIQKWEAPIPAQLAGLVEGPFPHYIRKTDQERIQNIPDEVFVDNAGSSYEVTVKLDGSSCTVFRKDDKFGVCSRNLWLKVNNENAENTFVRTAVNSELLAAMNTLGLNIAVQGELMGPGIQGNREQFKEHKLFVFDIWDINNQQYLSRTERLNTIAKLKEFGCVGVEHVPVVAENLTVEQAIAEFPDMEPMQALLKYAEGSSITNPTREGLVWKRVDGTFSFKTISNAYLLETGG